MTISQCAFFLAITYVVCIEIRICTIEWEKKSLPQILSSHFFRHNLYFSRTYLMYLLIFSMFFVYMFVFVNFVLFFDVFFYFLCDSILFIQSFAHPEGKNLSVVTFFQYFFKCHEMFNALAIDCFIQFRYG